MNSDTRSRERVKRRISEGDGFMIKGGYENCRASGEAVRGDRRCNRIIDKLRLKLYPPHCLYQ